MMMAVKDNVVTIITSIVTSSAAFIISINFYSMHNGETESDYNCYYPHHQQHQEQKRRLGCYSIYEVVMKQKRC